MMSTRRTLLTFGVLMATVALVIPSTAVAQAPTDPTAAGPVTVVDYDTVVVMWTPAADPQDTTGYEAGYVVATAAVQSGVTTPASFGATGPMTMAATGATTARVTIDGLTPGTHYLFAVRAVNANTTTTGATDRNGPWVLVPDSNGTDAGHQGSMTNPLPTPKMVTDVELTPYNGAIGVSWKGVDDPIGVHHYKLEAAHSGGTLVQGTEDGDAEEHVFMDLENGTEYSIRVMTVAMNPDGSIDGQVDPDGTPDRASAFTAAKKATPMADLDMPPGMDMDDMDDMEDDEEDDMMATPALPLLGILALFGGLLAAGRARLRR